MKIYSKFDNGFPQGKNMKRELMEKRKPDVAFQAENMLGLCIHQTIIETTLTKREWRKLS